jgi:formiminotetrahydrofolate cyclodeaminase
MIKDSAIKAFLDSLASRSVTPDGGNAAVIIGAMGAALVSMACNLTVGRAKYRDVEDEMKSLLIKSEDFRRQLTEMIQADVWASDAAMRAYGMPKGTDAEKVARSAAIQPALKQTTDIALRCCKVAREVIDLAAIATEKGNVNAMGDAGVGVFAAYTALRSGALNVYANAKLITDKTFTESRRRQVEELLGGAEAVVNSSISNLIPVKLTL